MDKENFIEFIAPDPKEFIERNHMGATMHVFPTKGLMTTNLEGTLWAVNPREYLILPSGSIVSDTHFSTDFQGYVMALSNQAINRLKLSSQYGAIGHMSLMRRPVMSLSVDIAANFQTDLLRLKQRVANVDHRYYEESVLAQLSAHVLDLYDVHAEQNIHHAISDRYAAIAEKFIKLLFDGEYIAHREVKYYADKLCISPKHLADVCVTVSGQPPLYWINRFTTKDLVCRLSDKNQSLSQIAFDMNFSSLSHLSRYCTKHLGMSPTNFRNMEYGAL